MIWLGDPRSRLLPVLSKLSAKLKNIEKCSSSQRKLSKHAPKTTLLHHSSRVNSTRAKIHKTVSMKLPLIPSFKHSDYAHKSRHSSRVLPPWLAIWRETKPTWRSLRGRGSQWKSGWKKKSGTHRSSKPCSGRSRWMRKLSKCTENIF